MHNIFVSVGIVIILCFLVLKYLNYLIMRKRRDVLQVSKEIYMDGPRDLFYEKLFADIQDEHSLTQTTLLGFIDRNLLNFKETALKDKGKIIQQFNINKENFVDQNFNDENIQILFIYSYSLGELLYIKNYIKEHNHMVYHKEELEDLKNKIEAPSISSFYDGKNFLLS